MTITYKQIFDENFLSNFEESKRKQFQELELYENEYSINLDKVIELLDLNVQKLIIDAHSGKLSDNTIYINVTENESRQRFTMAHEIGHFVLGHQGENGVNYRSDLINGIEERQANDFAAKLLMPKELIIRTLKKVLDDFGYSITELNQIPTNLIISRLSEYMKVSKSAMRYRLINLHMLVEGE